ncbi:Microphthalmia-associated transcription factor [Echinococcus granulosus]|uniref:Microphthalmia-associated transcription factor n=1 Tax=Echinococcus granulosus TaxID=6210 RepID=W6UWQ0_ECHGR|nr:Microphthalmia-associated transcription factor [Echinococcus granulosus]EUB65081.1 Microphthalmia-associated transcription factor [Echinococcus granulosus]
MSVGEGANQTPDSQRRNQYHQIATGSESFFPSTSQSLAARQQHRAPAINYSFVHSPEQQGIPINYRSHNYNHRSCFPCLPNSGGTVSVSENDSAVQLSADHSNPNPLNELDFRLMNIEPNMSPSSGITSPMDLGFTNIGDEQSIDNIDLNNITPSIKLASSLTLLGPSDFPSGGGNGSGGGNNSGRRGKLLVKSDISKGRESGGGFGGSEMPSTSCPADDSGGAYLTVGESFESPTGALSIPRARGGGNGNASGGSGASSVTGTWGGSSLTSLSGPPNLPMLSGNSASNDNQRVAMIRARSKKDSHNRTPCALYPGCSHPRTVAMAVERKRRDYINCQITELGTLLPEEMFRENDCKKNKGSILKNSVEYISALQRENHCYADLYNETNLANSVIDRLVKRIQDLESLLPSEYLTKVALAGPADYRQMLQEWSKLHDSNQQKISSSAAAAGASAGTVGGRGGVGQVSVDTSESSPGMSSVGNNDDIGTYLDARGDSNSPVPLVGRPSRTRCTSTSSTTGQPMTLSVAGSGVGGTGGIEGAPLAAPPLVGSLPSRGARILPATSPPNPTQAGGRLTQMRPLFSQLYTSGGGAKHPSPPSGRIAGKRTASGRPPATKMEEGGAIAVPKQSPVFSANSGSNTFCGGGSSRFGGLSASLPVRMAPDDFPSTSEMNTDEPYLRMTSDSGERGRCQDGMATAFKPEPMAEVSCNPPTTFHSHSYQPQFGAGGGASGGGVQPIWAQRLSRPLSAGQHQQLPTETSPAQQASGMSDELQFDHAM